MLKSLFMRALQFFEEYKEHGLSATWNKLIFRKTEFVLVVKDLTELKSSKVNLSDNGLRFVDISINDLKNSGLKYPVKSRYYKLRKYTQKGYRVFGLVKGDVLIGDVGYMTCQMARQSPIRDLNWFGIELGEQEAYMFDMFVSADQRGNNTTSLLTTHALRALREKGKVRTYGYFDCDNIPALWFHRMHGYKELDKIKIHQFFLIKRVLTD